MRSMPLTSPNTRPRAPFGWLLALALFLVMFGALLMLGSMWANDPVGDNPWLLAAKAGLTMLVSGVVGLATWLVLFFVRFRPPR